MVQKSATMQEVPLNKDIYSSTPLTQQHQQQSPVPQSAPLPQAGNAQPAVQPSIIGDPALLNSLIERVSSVEKQITKFVNLIERRVAKNAKEIIIRIKLDNDSTDTE